MDSIVYLVQRNLQNTSFLIPLKLLLSSVIDIMNDVLTAMNQDDLTFFHDSQAEIQFEDIIDCNLIII